MYRFSFSGGNRCTGLPGLTFQTGIDLHVYHSTQGIDLQIYLYSRHRFSGLPFQKYIRKMYFLSCMYKNSKKVSYKKFNFSILFSIFLGQENPLDSWKILCESNPAELPSCLLPNFGNLQNQIKKYSFYTSFTTTKPGQKAI